jgi:hypothetical protein
MTFLAATDLEDNPRHILPLLSPRMPSSLLVSISTLPSQLDLKNSGRRRASALPWRCFKNVWPPQAPTSISRRRSARTVFAKVRSHVHPRLLISREYMRIFRRERPYRRSHTGDIGVGRAKKLSKKSLRTGLPDGN